MYCILLVLVGIKSIVVTPVGDDIHLSSHSFRQSTNIFELIAYEMLYSRWHG